MQGAAISPLARPPHGKPPAHGAPRPLPQPASSSPEPITFDEEVFEEHGGYIVGPELGRGGMASVHIGAHVNAPHLPVAIKRMLPHWAGVDDVTSSFLDEARLVAHIRHPNVVRIREMIKDGEGVTVVTEYVHGCALSHVLKMSPRPIPPGVAVAITCNVLDALTAAHSACDDQGSSLDIVHRDVSPHNILIGADGEARLIDFGIAKARGRIQETREGHVKGKFPYLAPEQLSGGEVTPRTDIYATGVVLWEALVGRRLFDEPNVAATIHRVLTERVTMPGNLVLGVSGALDDVVAKSIDRNPSARFASAHAMSRALEKAYPRASIHEVSEWFLSVAKDVLWERERALRELQATIAAPTATTPRLMVTRETSLLDDATTLSRRSGGAKLSREPALTPSNPVRALGAGKAAKALSKARVRGQGAAKVTHAPAAASWVPHTPLPPVMVAPPTPIAPMAPMPLPAMRQLLPQLPGAEQPSPMEQTRISRPTTAASVLKALPFLNREPYRAMTVNAVAFLEKDAVKNVGLPLFAVFLILGALAIMAASLHQ